jgi:hypothetical protein
MEARMTSARWGRVVALALVTGTLCAFPAIGAAQQNRSTNRQPGLLERAGNVATNLWTHTRNLFGRLVDWGEAAIDWTKKKWADSRILKSLYGFLRGNPVIQWISRTGKQVVRRLERSARAMVGTPKPTAVLPPFLQRLADWRKKRAGGRR